MHVVYPLLIWCAWRDLNPHALALVPKTSVSASSTTGACYLVAQDLVHYNIKISNLNRKILSRCTSKKSPQCPLKTAAWIMSAGLYFAQYLGDAECAVQMLGNVFDSFYIFIVIYILDDAADQTA